MIETNKITKEEFDRIITDIKNTTNSDLTKVMDFLSEDFEETKGMILGLTRHLDNIEELYNKLLKEHESRIHGERL